MKLTAFDQKSILYVSLLQWSKKAIFTEHECSCEYCDADILICPNCEAGNVEIKEEEVKCVRVQHFGDRPNGDDDSFTEFTSWMHPFIGGARSATRSAEEGLVIDDCTVITFLGKTTALPTFDEVVPAFVYAT